MKSMFNKEDNADTEVGKIGKKMIVGAVFIAFFLAVLPPLTGVDLVNLCVKAEEGQATDANGCKTLEQNRLSEGYDNIKPYIILGMDMLVVVLVLAMLFGPGVQLAKYQFVPKNDSR